MWDRDYDHDHVHVHVHVRQVPLERSLEKVLSLKETLSLQFQVVVGFHQVVAVVAVAVEWKQGPHLKQAADAVVHMEQNDEKGDAEKMNEGEEVVDAGDDVDDVDAGLCRAKTSARDEKDASVPVVVDFDFDFGCSVPVVAVAGNTR